MKPATPCNYDDEKHEYTIGGAIVPHVTGVLADLLPSWKAAEWYLQRGRAVHACAAMIAQGVEFEHDPRIAGQVAACKKFFADLKPRVVAFERPVFSRRYRYGGTLDLLAKLPGRFLVIDYKATLTEAVPLQCAAYALAMEEAAQMSTIQYGAGVELREDGTYKMSDIYKLARFRQEWLALLTAFNIRKHFKVRREGEAWN